MLEWFIS